MLSTQGSHGEAPVRKGRRGAPRPSKARVAIVCNAIAEGATQTEACELIGLTRQAFLRWCVKAPDIDAAHREAMRLKADMKADEVLTKHDDLDDFTATVPRIKLREQQANNAK